MSASPHSKIESVPAPVITYPAADAETGPATLLLGIGVPGAFVEVWDIEHTQLHGKGSVNANGRWAFSFSGDLAQGPHRIHARQTFNDETSPWTDIRLFNVLLQPDVNAPAIGTPLEGEQTDNAAVLSGDVRQPGGIVDIIDLDANLWIASATVEGDLSWQAQASSPLSAGPHRISAIHRVAGKVSDWARIRTFSVRDET
ncbi:hypothetical protein [Pseudomonas sp. NPDC087615]|uniref:hypothetical protein n=1 Tax=Pseudomonas sp. NPDC087615 TaxID=3364443 RepID=UPI0037FB4A11